MSATKIEWADAVWNPITGCTPVSEGCRNCYAKRMANRLKGRCGYPADDPFRPGTVHWDKLEDPLRWHKPRRVFVCSMGDLFHPCTKKRAVVATWVTMAACPQHTFIVLTKRPDQMAIFMRNISWPEITEAIHHRDLAIKDMSWPLPNVWLGVSVEDQRTADERIPILLQTPATLRFVSCEPLLGPVDLEAVPYDPPGYEGFPGMHNALSGEWWPAVGDAEAEYRGRLTELPKIDWVIVGGETGPGARPMHPDWARSLRDQCQEAGVPFFFKSWGEWAPEDFDDVPCFVEDRVETMWPDGTMGPGCADHNGGPGEVMARIGKKAAGRLLDGREWSQWPGEAVR